MTRLIFTLMFAFLALGISVHAGPPAILDAESRAEGEEIFRHKVRTMKERAEDFFARQLTEELYQKKRQAAREIYREKVEEYRQWREKVRKDYAEEVQDDESRLQELRAYREYLELAEKRALRYEIAREKYSERQDLLKELEEQSQYAIPEDEELGLDYDDM